MFLHKIVFLSFRTAITVDS